MAAVIVLALAALAVVGALHGQRLERKLTTLPTSIRTAQTAVEDGRLSDAQAILAQAQNTLGSVQSSLSTSPDFRALDLLPVAHQNIAVVRDAVGLGLRTVNGAQQILAAATPLRRADGHLELSLTGGQVPLPTVQAARSAVTSVASVLPTTAMAPHRSFVLDVVRRGADRVYAEAANRRRELVAVGNGLSLVNLLAGGDGDRHFLVAVANTAEMRGAGGMILSYGTISGSRGRITMGHFGPIDEIPLSAPAATSFPADFTADYGALRPTQQWRQATLMSDFTVDGPVLEAMYRQATGQSVDGVIQVDPSALAAVLTGTGPVTVAGLGQIDASNVVATTLNSAYVNFPDRPVRQEYLGTVARDSFAALTSRAIPSLRQLGTALVTAAARRHVVMHAATSSDEAIIGSLGFDGALPGPGRPFTQLTVQNIGGDKMDYYLRSVLAVTGAAPSTRPAAATVSVTLADTAPVGGLPPYIFGPFLTSTDPPGTYRGLVTVYLPRFTSLTGSSGDAASTGVRAGTQNGVTALTWTVDIPAGGTSRVDLQVLLPPIPGGSPPFVVVPSPRVVETTTSIGLH